MVDEERRFEAERRVVLVSGSSMFHRVFGKLLTALRDDLTLEERAGMPAPDTLPPETTIMLDASGLGPDALALTVGEAVSARAARVVVVLDESDDLATEAAMAAGAAGVLLKAAPPGVIAEWLDALLAGERVRPAPTVALDADALSPALRARLSARQQKLLRLQLGGTSIAETARLLALTPARVVTDTRVVMDIVRGRDGDS